MSFTAASFGFGAGASGVSRFAATRGRINGSLVQGVNYPSPFFDLAHTYLPTTVKQMFQFCRYYFLTNPLINATVFKLSEYPITDLIIDHADEKVKKRWMEYFHDHLRYRSFQVESGLDYHAYGNCAVSLSFPFFKFLTCRVCAWCERADKTRPYWTFTNYDFRLNCPRCGHTADAIAQDHYYPNASGIKPVRWNVEDIEITYNDITGKSTYFYNIPGPLQSDIVIGKKDVVESIPQIFIQALRQRKGIIFSKDNFFHLKRPTLAWHDRGWGTPLILPVLKDTFYLQLMKKAQEAVLLEHVVPLRVIFPQAASGTSDPFTTLNLTDWKEQVAAEIARWRFDNNYIPVMPIPMGHQSIGGDGKALLLFNEMQALSEHIIMGMGVPREFLMGGLCLTPDALVTTSRGLLRLDELTPMLAQGDRCQVMSHQGYRTASQGHYAGVKKIWRVKTRSGLELTGAATHPLYVLNDDMSTSFLPIHDILPQKCVGVKVGANLWPEAAPTIELSPSKIGGRFARSDLDDVQLPGELTPELARVLGYLVAEGSCASDRRMGFSITDADTAKDFAECVHTVFGIKPTICERPYARSDGENKTLFSVEVSRQTVVEALQSLGLKAYSAEKTVPKIIRSAPRHLVVEFLRAYFDGDGGGGTYNNRSVVTATSTSHRLLQEVQLLLLNLGIVSSVYPAYQDKEAMTLQVRSEFARKFTTEVGFVSQRKRALVFESNSEGVQATDKLPGLRSALLAARDRHVHGFGSWRFEAVDLPLEHAEYTTAQVADLVGRDPSSIRNYIKAGKLRADLREGEYGRFSHYVVQRDELRRFLMEHGLGRRRAFRVHQYELTYDRARSADWSAVRELEPVLYENIQNRLNEEFFWDEVVSVEELEIDTEMLDIGVDGAHSYQANGIICHNSYAGTNVSMRMLENQFISYLSRHRAMANWIMKTVAHYMDWPEANIRFKPFKMADDLQRKAYMLQLNQMGKISDTTLLVDSDLDQAEENEIMSEEADRRIDGQKKQQLAMAEIQGEAQLIMMKFQAKAQEAMMAAQTGPVAPGEPGGPEGALGPGGAQDMAATGGIPQQASSQLGPEQRLAAGPEGQPGTEAGGDITMMAQGLAHQIAELPPDQHEPALQAIAAQSPELAQLTAQILSSLTAGQQAPPAVDTRPLPEKLPPRRQAALV